MTLRARLALGLAIIAVVLLVPLIVTRSGMLDLHDDMRQLQSTEFAASLRLGRVRDALSEVRDREFALAVVEPHLVEGTHDQLVGNLTTARAVADTLMRTSGSTPPRSRADSAAIELVRNLAVIAPAIEREYQAVRAGRDSLADSISRFVVAPAMRLAERALPQMDSGLKNRTSERVDDAAESLKRAEDASIVAMLVALVLVGGIAIWLTRSISRPVEALERGMRAVAEGELDHQLALSSKRRDEFGRLAASFREMSRQLIELDKLKAEFVSVASHELKTPINVILGYLQLMQDGIYGPLSSKQTEVLSTVEAQGRTLARLAAHLLDVTRFEAGGGRIDPRPVQLTALLEDLKRAFHVLAVQRGVDFQVTLTPGLPIEVQWDVDRINEVMGNLLANAFKFTGDGGTVELIATAKGDTVCIEVRDSGAGVPPAQLPHIFEKFYQADNQDAASATGSGLGLAIAKEIVEAHRGEIRCDSTVGKGTTFTLMLPVMVGKRRTGSYRTVEYEAVS